MHRRAMLALATWGWLLSVLAGRSSGYRVVLRLPATRSNLRALPAFPAEALINAWQRVPQPVQAKLNASMSALLSPEGPWKQHLELFRERMLEFEKADCRPVASPPAVTMSAFAEALVSSAVGVTPQSVHTSAVVACMTTGAVVGWVVYRRLWLPLSLLAGWWASYASHLNSVTGRRVRELGSRIALLWVALSTRPRRQLQVAYRTGQVAWLTSRMWELCSDRLSLPQKLSDFRRRMLARAVETPPSQPAQLRVLALDAWHALRASPASTPPPLACASSSAESTTGALSIPWAQTLSWAESWGRGVADTAVRSLVCALDTLIAAQATNASSLQPPTALRRVGALLLVLACWEAARTLLREAMQLLPSCALL